MMLSTRLSLLCNPIKKPMMFSARLMSRKTYGFEEGHGEKNEVKKDHWIRRKKVRTTGQYWRSTVGLSSDPFKNYTLLRKPDWRFKDGSPGYYTPKQSEAIDIMADMCEDVQKVLKLLNKKV